MAIGTLQTLQVIEVMENFIDRKRPPENIRHLIDLSYKIIDQSIEVFEIRPRPNKPEEKMECKIAKATFLKTKNHWKVYWWRSDMKWHSYKPNATLQTLSQFIQLIEKDELGCFWG